MAQPLDAVTAILNAFRRDMQGIDAAALYAARGKPGLGPVVECFRFFNEVLVWHATGEEVGILSGAAPQDRFPEVVVWMFPWMDHDDRENLARIWQTAMPPPGFARAKQLIQVAVGDDWAELTRRRPTLV